MMKTSTRRACCSKTPRFDKENIDPETMTMHSPQPIDYDQINTQKKDPWRYKMELEDWSKNLGYRNQKILLERQFRATLLGPAWHEVKELPKYEPACKDVGFGRTPRFKKRESDIPGPGTYCPVDPLKPPCCYSFPHTCRFKDPTPPWSVPPNRYHIIDTGDMDYLRKKIVSLRGPYDLFTGNRDHTTFHNHFSVSKTTPEWWPINFPNSLDELQKRDFGKFNKIGMDVHPRNRFAASNLGNWPRNPNEPGPATYLPEPLEKQWKQSMYGFNSSDVKPRNRVKQAEPSMGMYEIQKRPHYKIAGNGHRSVFLSKVQRTIGAILPEKMNSF